MTSYQIVCVGPSLAASLQPLAHHWNVASLSLFYSYCFGRCSSELPKLVPLPHSCGSSTLYSNRFHDFSVTFPRFYKDFYVNSFFPRTARLWNSLPAECFPLTSDLNGFNLELIGTFSPWVLSIWVLSLGFFPYSFLLWFSSLFSCNSIPRNGFQPCMEWSSI